MNRQYIEDPTWDHTMADHFHKFYLDYVNNYAAVETIAEHHCMSLFMANIAIDMGRIIHEQRAAAYKEATNG